MPALVCSVVCVLSSVMTIVHLCRWSGAVDVGNGGDPQSTGTNCSQSETHWGTDWRLQGTYVFICMYIYT